MGPMPFLPSAARCARSAWIWACLAYALAIMPYWRSCPGGTRKVCFSWTEVIRWLSISSDCVAGVLPRRPLSHSSAVSSLGRLVQIYNMKRQSGPASTAVGTSRSASLAAGSGWRIRLPFRSSDSASATISAAEPGYDLFAIGLSALYAVLVVQVLVAVARWHRAYRNKGADTKSSCTSADLADHSTSCTDHSKCDTSNAPASPALSFSLPSLDGSPALSNADVEDIEFPIDDDNEFGIIGCTSGLRPTSLEHSATARHAWAPINWRTIKLRVGPDYKRLKRKRPTSRPLLPCSGVDILQGERKVFSDGKLDASCLPPEVAAAATEPTPPRTPSDSDRSTVDGSSSATSSEMPLPKFLAVSISMPRYSGPSVDGSNVRYHVFHQVPPTLRDDASASPAARLLCEFLDGSAEGHAAAESKFYDRFKIIVRMCSLDGGIKSPFLRKMVDWFNGKCRGLKYSQSGLTCSLASPTPLSQLCSQASPCSGASLGCGATASDPVRSPFSTSTSALVAG